MDEARARELLTQHRERIESALAGRERGGETDEQPIDSDAELHNEEVDEGLADDLRRELAAIERAEQRLADGTFGVSIESGERIPDGRLETIPWAERTADEQQHHESHR